MTDISVYAAAFAIGLFGGAHCLGMCGGIMAALSFAIPATERWRRLWILLSYNAGRIGSYCLIGAVGGWLGSQVAQGLGLMAMRTVAGLLLVAMGLYLADWWRGLTYLEKLGGYLWRYLQPLSRRLMPVAHAPQALLLGAVWGWLPCGLVYTALAYGVAQASAGASALVMLAFGLGTLPAVLAGGLLAERLKQTLQNRRWRALMGLLVIGFGIWTLAFVFLHAGHADHGAHGGADHSQMDHEHMNHSQMDHEQMDHSQMQN
jgi:sulfite exporter TauE/SafE